MKESVSHLTVGIISLGITIALYLIIPIQVSMEAIPGTGDYVTITAATFPRLCVGGFSILSLILIAKSFFLFKTEIPDSTRPTIGLLGWRNFTVITIIIISYMSLIEPIGYLISTIICLIIMNFYFGTRNIWQIILGGIALPAALYILFSRVLLIQLPTGYLFD